MHQPFSITIKNYRSFADSNPTTLEIRPGFTAFVGPNNSGKSSLLRFFYETRPLFRALHFGKSKELFGDKGLWSGKFEEIDDHTEPFFNGNTREMSIQLDIPDFRENGISRVLVRRNRDSVAGWMGEAFSGEKHVPVKLFQDADQNWTMGDAAQKVHEVDMMPYYRVCGRIDRMLYVGPYRNALSMSGGTYYDLNIGTAFIHHWNEWKTGKTREHNAKIQQVTSDIARIFGFRTLEINAAEQNTVMQVIVDGQSYRLRELGAGIAQCIIVLATVALRETSFVLIDEPELNLHPSLQVGFLTAVGAYATDGVMFATHSIGLARATAERIYSFQKPERVTLVDRFERTRNYAEFLGELSFSAFRDLGHDSVLLVEGVNEVLAVQQFLRLLGMDHRVVVLPLGGTQLIRGGVEQELGELRRLTNHIAVLIDSEKKSLEDHIPKERIAFRDSCEKLGFAVHLTERRAFENYFPAPAIRNVKGSNYRALEPYELLTDADPCWAKHENWKIAREMTLDDLMATDVGRFLGSLFEQELQS